MTLEGLLKTGAVLGAFIVTRIVARWRTERKEQEALRTPLVDAVLLETVFAPRAGEGDDTDLLAEMRDTLAHLNRRAYVEEFWNLHAQLAALDQKLGTAQKATLRRVLHRLLQTQDRWLQLVAAKTAAELHFTEAATLLPPLLEHISDSDTAGDMRYRQELETALATLQTASHQDKP